MRPEVGNPRRTRRDPAYLGLTALCIRLAEHPDFGFLNVLVLLFFWNAAKFAWMAVLSPVLLLRIALVGRASSSGQRAELGADPA